MILIYGKGVKFVQRAMERKAQPLFQGILAYQEGNDLC